ncbi:MAG: metallophosphoesterase [Clostridiales bacterium]|nr:metallophosphoesterase [Clostridiales bacterium]
MKSLFAFFMSIISFISSLLGLNPVKVIQPFKTDSFEPVVRFMVCSDTHMNLSVEERIGRIPKAFDFAYAFAQEDENYKKLDAAMFVGDLTDNGTKEQFALFESQVKEGIREGTTLLAIAAKNHDGYVGVSCLDSLKAITNMDSDFHTVINGFHFIGISRSKNEVEHYSPYQRRWLKEQLDEAKKDNPDKPIFVCHHEHVSNTVYGSSSYEGWGRKYFKDIFEQYPQVVHFSGHSHYPLNDPRSVFQGDFTAVGTGSMAYMEMTYKLDRTIHPGKYNEAAQAWIVEADAENKIRLTGYDVLHGDILCQYVIPSLTDKDTFVYTEKNMKMISSAPVFDEKSEITVKKEEDGKYTVSVPKANSVDGNIIFLYRIKVYNKMGVKVHSEYIINNYWQNDTYNDISFNIKAKPGYEVKITAENAYYMESQPVTATIS